MDKAKAAVKDFVSHSGQHDTTVHEKVAPAVTHENIQKQKHEEVTTAIDREVHQDHYHTTVQPVKDRQVLPEEHHHRVVPVEQREHHHGKDTAAALKQGLNQERAQFQSTRTEAAAKESHATLPTVAGEHAHHHVHETIQPVVNKETIQPSVVHTTVPIHEVHHNAAQHHAATALPAVSMSEFKREGGTLAGREEKYDGFKGEPTAFSKTASPGDHHNITAKPATTTGTTGTTGTTTGAPGSVGATDTRAGPHKSDLANKADPRVDSDRDGSRTVGNAPNTTTSTGTGHTGPTAGYTGPTTGTTGTTAPTSSTAPTTGSTTTDTHRRTSLLDKLRRRPSTDKRDSLDSDPSSSTHGTGTNTTTTEKKKPSLLDRLNPRKDADHDGKKGLMD